MCAKALFVLCLITAIFPINLRATDEVLITEFMAANGSTFQDEDNTFPDWIEIHNAGTNTVDLGGWFLTDSSSNLRKWQFPSTNLTPSAYLVVFASGKNRRIPGAPLHTSFSLSAGGEYLGLVRPDGTNVVSAYSPVFPPQASDVSFGIITASPGFSLLSTAALARVQVPLDGSLAADWTTRTFDDSAWNVGTNGLGFDVRTVQVLADDFSVARDYSAGNVSGSIWSGFQRGGDTVVTAANANTTNPGRLTLGSRLGNWENGDSDGMLLYIANVTNDFTAEVEIPVSDNPQYHSMGLMARVADINAAGAGEDWVAAMMFDQFSVGATMRSTDNGASTTPATGLTHRFLRLQRAGNLFTVLSKASAGEAYSVRATATRLDLEGVPLQVGVWQATYSGNIGTAQLDNFRLTLGAADGVLTYDSLVKTDLRSTMLGANNAGLNASAYVRLPFVLTNAADLGQLTLRMRYDDGFAAFLNGVEVARRNAPASLSWNSLATAERTKPEGIAAEAIDLSAFLNVLGNGTNVLAVQGLNARASDPDFLLLAELETSTRVAVQTDRWRYFVLPTPGQPNGLGSATLGAVVNSAEHTPALVGDGDNIIVTAKVRPTFDAVTNVTLRYRVMWSNEVALAMFDDGAHGDGAAGDGLFGASIPAAASTPRQMVRWFVTAADTSGTVSRWPLFEDPDGSPEYFGTVIGDPGITTQLPVFQYFIQNTNWYKLPNNGPYDKNTTNSSVYYLGRFYDNVRVRIRGASSVYWKFPKQSMHFDFNPGHRFYYSEDRVLQDEININALWVDKGYVRNNLSMQEVYRAAGVIAQDTFFVLAYLNSGLHSVATFIEEPDQQYLSRHGLDPEGAYYKMYNPLTDAAPRPAFVAGANPDSTQGVEKRTRRREDNSDLQAIIDGVRASNPGRSTFVFDNFDVPQVINYFAASVIIQDWDRYPKNTFMYRDTLGTRLWQIHPWDADLSWGYNGWQTDEIVANHPTMSHPFYGDFQHGGTYGGTHVLNDAFYKTPALRDMFLRRLRTLLEQILQAPGTPTNQLKLEAKLHAYSALMGAEVETDKQRWGLPFGTNQTFAQAIGVLKNAYLAPRRTNLFVTYGAPGGLIPPTQSSNPAIEFGAIEFNPASGKQAEEYLCLTNANHYAVDIAGWRLEGGINFTFKPGTVLPSNSVVYLTPDVVAFRARGTGPRGGQGLFVLGNYQGQLSARGESLQLVNDQGRPVRGTNYAGAPSLVQQFLRVTELMYNPAPLPGNTNEPQQFEFIELKNISTTQTLDLNGVRLTNGIDFAFTGSGLTSLAPGAHVVVVKNLAAFLDRYGAGPNVAGQFTGSLENNGERIVLLDASGEEILDFTYSDGWYPITDGLGFSLVVVDENAEPDAWSSRANWRPSGLGGGSPSGDEPAPIFLAPIVINEVLANSVLPQTDVIELFNPTTNAVNLGGWYLTDDFFTPKKYRIPSGTILSNGAYLVFTEAQFNSPPDALASFALGSDGDEVWLFSGDEANNLTGYVHGFDFGASEDNVSFGRHLDSVGGEHFPPQISNTFGAINAGPRVGPVVISEILYHPLDFGEEDNSQHEFIELANLSPTAVRLFSTNQPTDTWQLRDAVDFDFPTNILLAPDERILIVPFNPTNLTDLSGFRTRHEVAPGVRIFGPYAGQLDNSGDSVELVKPLPTGTNGTIRVRVDQVNYKDATPWPGAADGFGPSLHRLASNAYGNDPASWTAAKTTAGLPYPGGITPSITTQPAGATRVGGQDTTFSVTATGPALLYQWRANGTNLMEATNALLVLTNLQWTQAGNYEVAVFNVGGGVISSNAHLNVLSPVTFTLQPTNQNVLPGTNVTLAAAATGSSTVRYQWRLDGIDILGATNAAYSFSNATLTQQGHYSVVAADDFSSATSSSAFVFVLVRPGIVSHPVAQTVVQGGTARFSVIATGAPPLYFRWLRNGALWASNNFPDLVITNCQSNGTFRVTVGNLAGTANSVPSGGVALTVLRDFDGDGLADAWETNYPGFSTNNAADALLDFDGDGMINRDEFGAGTNPTDPRSLLKIILSATNSSTLQFVAQTNLGYTLQWRTNLTVGTWLNLSNIAPQSQVRTMEWNTAAPPADGERFYRIVTPIVP